MEKQNIDGILDMACTKLDQVANYIGTFDYDDKLRRAEKVVKDAIKEIEAIMGEG